MNKISYLYHKYYSQYLSTCILIINLYNPRNELQGLILIHLNYYLNVGNLIAKQKILQI